MALPFLVKKDKNISDNQIPIISQSFAQTRARIIAVITAVILSCFSVNLVVK